MQKRDTDYDFLKSILIDIKDDILKNYSFTYPLSEYSEDEITVYTALTYDKNGYWTVPHYNNYKQNLHHFSVIEQTYIADPIPDYLQDEPIKSYVNFGYIRELPEYEINFADEDKNLDRSEKPIPEDEEESEEISLALFNNAFGKFEEKDNFDDMAKTLKKAIKRKEKIEKFDPIAFLNENEEDFDFDDDDDLDEFVDKMKEYHDAPEKDNEKKKNEDDDEKSK